MPDNTPELVSLAEQFTGLPMSDLIGAPLLAAAEANAMMAATQTKSLLDIAFSYNKAENTYTPVLIKMTLTRSAIVPPAAANPPTTPPTTPSPTVVRFQTTFDLPLLTILPLNSLAVDDVNVSFDMEVKSSYSDKINQETMAAFSTESKFDTKFGFGLFSATVMGSVSYDSSNSSSRDTYYEKSNSAQYKVRVHAGQLALPQGVNTIIQAFANSISPITLPTPAP